MANAAFPRPTVQRLVKWQSDGVAKALNAGKQVIMDEFNTASCGGEPGRSDTVCDQYPNLKLSIEKIIPFSSPQLCGPLISF